MHEPRQENGKERVMTPLQVSRLLGLSLNAVYSAIHKHELPAVKIGGRYFVAESRLMGLFAAGPQQQEGVDEDR